MLRATKVFSIENPEIFKQKLLIWANQFGEVVFLDSNNYHHKYSNYDAVLAVDAFTSIKTDYFNAFEDLHQYQTHTKDWLFGYLSYDLKNDTEALTSKNFDGLEFPDLFFFQPKKLFFLKGNQVEMQYLNLCDDEMDDDFYEIFKEGRWKVEDGREIKIQQRISKEAYLQKVSKMLEYIHHGDIYEANFCMEFYAENAAINPIEIYHKLNAISQPPFAVYFKNNHHFLMSASPERYLKKEGTKVISQPIKGTAKRNSYPILDEQSKVELENNPKERAENIMVSDLVRNDLSRTAQKGSVKVEELCGIYSFQQVHQMISTITSKLDAQYAAVDALRHTFPMGSMTGAPKKSVMETIDLLEPTKRGLYSGTVGYINPGGDFDFNVVIRSIFYNSQSGKANYQVGGGITIYSDPEKEYEECLLKAAAIKKVLSNNDSTTE